MNMIVAFCKNRGIGYKNNLPWHLKNELKYFKRKTTKGNNNVVIMGKNTWESLPNKPLSNRKNIILSKSLDNNILKNYDNTYAVKNFHSLNVEINNLVDNHKLWLIGGKSIYDYYIQHPKLHKIYVTHINNDFLYDVQFPKIPNNFILTKLSKSMNENNIEYKYAIYSNNAFI